jgi:hypothetical protein
MLLECKFWLEGDRWNATVESLGLTIYAPSFEAAKNDMELALGKHIEFLLGERAAGDLCSRQGSPRMLGRLA